MPQVLPDVPGDGSSFDIAELDRLGFFSALDAARDGIAVGRGMLAEGMVAESEGQLGPGDRPMFETLIAHHETAFDRVLAEPGSRQAVLELRGVAADMHGFTCELRRRRGRGGALTHRVAEGWTKEQRARTGADRRVRLSPRQGRVRQSRPRQTHARRRVTRSSRSPDDSGPSEPPGLARGACTPARLRPRVRGRS